MSVRKINGSTLTAIADAIRSKTGGSALIFPEDMASEIASISGGSGLVKKTGSFILDSDYTYAIAVNTNYTGRILVDTGLNDIYAIFVYSETWLNQQATSNCWGACGFINNGIPCLAGNKVYPYHYGLGIDLGYSNGNYYQQDSVGGVILNSMNSGIPLGKFGMRVRNDAYPIRAGHTIRWEAIGEE